MKTMIPEQCRGLCPDFPISAILKTLNFLCTHYYLHHNEIIEIPSENICELETKDPTSGLVVCSV